jgi:DNA ligase 1
MAEKPWWKQAPVTSTPAAPSAPGPVPDDDLADGESREVKGSGAEPYVLKNTGGAYSCTCPAWRHQGGAIDRRTCKHLRALRGEAAEAARVGQPPARSASSGASSSAEAGKAPPLLLAHSWQNDADLTGWWMSEKLDGVRAYWDGERFLSRLGNVYLAPDWFVEKLPKTPLDGELWGGRGAFQKTVSVVRRQDRGAGWRDVSFVVFDAPAEAAPFEARQEHVLRVCAPGLAAHLAAHAQVRCESLTHLREELHRVESLGGEGLMMRKPGSLYEVGRSHTLLKVKSFKDAEAEVVAHLPGMGKHKGRLGALECILADGTRFSVGTGLSDAERNAPPPVGSIVTVRYQELSNDGVPRFPSYVGVRHDAVFERKPVSPAVTQAPAVTPTESETPAYRRFVRDGVSWDIALEGATVVVRRFGGGGSVEITRAAFPDARAAWRDADRRIAEKHAAGYEEASD